MGQFDAYRATIAAWFRSNGGEVDSNGCIQRRTSATGLLELPGRSWLQPASF